MLGGNIPETRGQLFEELHPKIEIPFDEMAAIWVLT